MLAFAITTSMTLALGIFTIVRASHSKQELSRIESVWAPGSYAIGEMRAQFGDLRIYETSRSAKPLPLRPSSNTNSGSWRARPRSTSW
jgi:hypothetical protein